MEIRDFKKGDIITFCDEEFEVVKNYGNSGVVKDGNDIIHSFYWCYAGERCELKVDADSKKTDTLKGGILELIQKYKLTKENNSNHFDPYRTDEELTYDEVIEDLEELLK